MLFYLLLFLLPFASSFHVSNCDQCPPTTGCVRESKWRARCECTEGWFTKSLLVESLVDLHPADFLASREQLLKGLSTFVNKTVTIYRQGGRDRIFTLNDAWNRIPLHEFNLMSDIASFVDVDFFIDLFECYQSYYDLDRYTKKVRYFVKKFVEAKKRTDSRTTTTTTTTTAPLAELPESYPITNAFTNTVSIVTIAFLAALLSLMIVAIFCCKLTRREKEKRTHYIENPKTLPSISRSVSVRKSEYKWSVDV